jgi:RimK-like ATP-grasp domain
MILICGIPSESSLAMVVDALDRGRADYVIVNQRQVRQLAVEIDVDDAGVRGRITGPELDVDLEKVDAIYLRFMDDRRLPELEAEPPGSAARRAGRAFHDIIGGWADITGARVVNRYLAMGSNFSKPYQAQIIREHGFAIPATLVTNDPDQVLAFRAAHGPLIYKSISSERSIVCRLEDKDLDRLEKIRWCPVQFQEYVAGPNLRVHTVGDRTFATLVETDAVDYRYASRQIGRAASFSAYEPEAALAERCVGLARGLGLEVAGIDLKLAPDGRIVCLEANPSPVFSYYESHTAQPIADAIADLLQQPWR